MHGKRSLRDSAVRERAKAKGPKLRRFTVTKADIAKANKDRNELPAIEDTGYWAGHCCPIARCLRRATKTGRKDVVVGCAYAEIKPLGVVYPLPARARQFISRFDARKPVKPFSFSVKL